MATENPKWIEQVMRVVSQVEKAHQKAIADFMAKAESWGVPAAIEWHGADVVRRAEEWRQVKPIADLMAKEDVKPEEKLARIREGLAQRRRDVIDNLYQSGKEDPRFINGG